MSVKFKKLSIVGTLILLIVTIILMDGFTQGGLWKNETWQAIRQLWMGVEAPMVKAEPCRACHGTCEYQHEVDGKIRCPYCHGAGLEEYRKCSICQENFRRDSRTGRWAHGVMWVCGDQCLKDAYGDE